MLKNMFKGLENGVPLCCVQHSSAQVSSLSETLNDMNNTTYSL